MIRYTLSSTEEELRQILLLQQCNLPQSLPAMEATLEGFVTVHHDFEILKSMHDLCPHILAKEGAKVVGYALSMHEKFGTSIEVLKPMFKQISTHHANAPEAMRAITHNFIVMGQICIDKDYRKKGIFRKLYNTMRAHYIPPFSAIITEVDTNNERSLQAHYAVGFRELKQYHAHGQDWVLLYVN